MYGVAFFLHIGGLILWLGALAIAGIFLLAMRPHYVSAGVKQISVKITKHSVIWSYIGAASVLFSGVYMILQLGMDNKPFWLTAMERGGGMLLLLSIIFTAITAGKTIKRISQPDGQHTSVRGFLIVTIISIVCSLAVLFIVSMKY